MRRISFIILLAVLACLFVGCHTVHYSVNTEAVPVEALETYKQDNPDIPARIEVVNFVVNSVEAPYSDDEKNLFRRHNAIAIPNALQRSLGERKVFSEVRRTVLPEPRSADYIISGTYDFSDVRERGWFKHSITIKGTLHVLVVRAKDNRQILDKDFVEERSDEASSRFAIRVNYLQPAFIASITAEIKKYVAQDVGTLSTKTPGAK